MPLILRAYQSFPLLDEQGQLVDTPFATVAFVDEAGNQYAQINVERREIPEYCHPFTGDDRCAECELTKPLHIADHLVLSLGAGHGVDVPAQHGEMIIKAAESA